VVGVIPKAVREAPDFRAPMAERMGDAWGLPGAIAGHAIDAPGRLASQVPDSLFTRGFDRWGQAREISNMLDEAGISRLRPDLQNAEILRLKENPTPEEAARITEAGRTWAKQMGYRADPGKIERHIGSAFRPGDKPTTSADPLPEQLHDLVGSHLMPFFTALWQYNKQGLTFVPVLGSAIDTKLPLKDQVSRQAVGAVLGLWANDYAAKGGITGPGPEDPDEAAALRAKGIEPNSVYVPTIGYVPADVFGPAAPTLRSVGAYYDSQKYATDKEKADPNKMRDRFVADQARAYQRFPVAQAIGSLIKVTESFTEGATDLGAQAISSYVPGLSKANAASNDPMQRTTDKGGDWQERLRQKVVQRSGYIPGVGSREDLPAAQDQYGRPIENPRQGAAAYLPRVVQPKDDPDTRVFSENNVIPGRPPQELSLSIYQGKGQPRTPVKVALTPAEQREWNRIRGQELIDLGKELQRDRLWGQTPPEFQKQALEKALEQANEFAKATIMDQIGDDEIQRRMAGATEQKAS
jgi:hypothetical protein